MNDEDKPFDYDYVIRMTVRHMQRAVDLSIRKTFERVKDFENNPVKATEVFKTLSTLHIIRRQLDESPNPEQGIK